MYSAAAWQGEVCGCPGLGYHHYTGVIRLDVRMCNPRETAESWSIGLPESWAWNPGGFLSNAAPPFKISLLLRCPAWASQATTWGCFPSFSYSLRSSASSPHPTPAGSGGGQRDPSLSSLPGWTSNLISFLWCTFPSPPCSKTAFA